jgi:hypothetical protein
MGVMLLGKANREAPVRAEPHPPRSFALYLRRGLILTSMGFSLGQLPWHQCPEGSETPRHLQSLRTFDHRRPVF